MRFAYRFVAATAACLAGITAILMVLWPAWLGASDAILPWQATGWRLLLANSQNQAFELQGRPLLLVAITLLLAITMVSTSLSVIANHAAAAPQTAEADARAETEQAIGAEIAKLIALVRGLIEANGLFGAALAKANDQLPNMVNPEQIRMIVSYLILENDSMRKKTANLQSSLETAKRQVDQLKSNLATAKVEGVSDALTGVMNRRGFDLALANEIAEARGGGPPFSLILTDIDHFKTVNDRYGHQIGDEVLKWFAQALLGNVKGRDIVARYGGEEFAVILPQTPVDAAARLASQIKAHIDSLGFVIPGETKATMRLTASFGVAQWRDGEGTEALVRRTDAKLYEAKSTGRNKVAA